MSSRDIDQNLNNNQNLMDQRATLNDLQSNENDMIMIDDQSLLDQEIIADLETDRGVNLDAEMTSPSNFTLAQCVSGHLSINGEMIGAGIPCKIEGSEWVRVNPLTDVGFYVQDPQGAISEMSDPAFSVNTNYTYYLMKNEVKVSDYQSCVSDESSNLRCSDIVVGDDQQRCVTHNSFSSGLNEALPINCATWEESRTFCQWALGDLPSEVEWELAGTLARTKFPYHWPNNLHLSSSNELCEYVNTTECNNIMIRSICSGEHNAGDEVYPFCDLIGNLAEWMLDNVIEDQEVQEAWIQNSGETLGRPITSDLNCSTSSVDTQKVLRGGAFNIRPLDFSTGVLIRREVNCAARSPYTGFRCVIRVFPED